VVPLIFPFLRVVFLLAFPFPFFLLRVSSRNGVSFLFPYWPGAGDKGFSLPFFKSPLFLTFFAFSFLDPFFPPQVSPPYWIDFHRAYYSFSSLLSSFFLLRTSRFWPFPLSGSLQPLLDIKGCVCLFFFFLKLS